MQVVHNRKQLGAHISPWLKKMNLGYYALKTILNQVVSGNRIPKQAQRVAAQTGNFRNNIFLDTSQRICRLLGCYVRRRVFPQYGRWAGPSIPLDTLFDPIRPIQIYSGSRSSKPAGRI